MSMCVSGAEKNQAKLQEKSGTSNGWPMPIDIFGSPEVIGKPVLTPDMVPSRIWDFARDTSHRMGVNTAAIALSCVGAASGAVRYGWRVQPKLRDTTWRQSPILWIALTGQPSVKKTPVIEAALAPLRAIEVEWMEEDRAAWREYEKEKRVFDLQRAKWEEQKAKGGKDSGYTDEEPIEPEKPIRRRLLLEDTTPEAVIPIAQENPDNLLIAQDELTDWIGSFDAYRNGNKKDQAFYLKAYNGHSATVDRVNRHLFAKRLGLCVIGGIQDERLGELGAKLKRDGFLPRFLFVTAETTDQHDDVPDHAAIEAYAQMIRELTDCRPPCGDHTLRMSSEAATIRENLMELVEILRIMPTTPDGLVDHLGKYDGLFARLCVVYHLCGYAGADEISDEISRQTAQAVRNLMVRFFLPEAARIFGEVVVRPDKHSYARWLAGYILSSGRPRITLRDIGRAYRPLRDKQADARAVMAVLEKLGWARSSGDDPAFVKEWAVNPFVHEIFAERARQERLTREAVKQKIREGAEKLRWRSAA